MEATPGTYALVMRSAGSARLQVGRWGRLDVTDRYWIYVGSAFGPGGVRARVLRHCRASPVKHWHIDYLRAVAVPLEAWCAYGQRDLEHHWARALAESPDVAAQPGFGCSDCTCVSHLFSFPRKPDLARFGRVLGASIEIWQPVHAHTCHGAGRFSQRRDRGAARKYT